MTVIGIADGIAVRLGDGDEAACVVVLVLRHARGGGDGGDGGQQTDFVIGMFLRLLPGVVLGGLSDLDPYSCQFAVFLFIHFTSFCHQ